jgi:GH15 family glucan-1,4-alpha-glucosidase
LERVTKLAGLPGLLPEGVDARSGTFRGNYPLLFSHAEYIRAVLAIEHARSRRS